MFAPRWNRRAVRLPVFAAAFFSFSISALSVHAQGSSGASADIESRTLIDLPTAGLIPHGGVALDMDFYQSGGVLAGVSVGLWNRLMAGISYGGADLLGMETPTWNKAPGLSLKVRLLEETLEFPAVALGFSSQGKEAFLREKNRYLIKSRGIYAVMSKNYTALGSMGFHGGVNYSFETDDGDTDPDLFFAVEKSITPFASAVAEYDLGVNDSNSGALGRGRGYLNLGFDISVGSGFTIGLNFKDLLKNQQTTAFGNRTIRLEFVRIR